MSHEYDRGFDDGWEAAEESREGFGAVAFAVAALAGAGVATVIELLMRYL